MKLHIITVGQPKLAYAVQGWDEYWRRLGGYHNLRATHIPDRQNDAGHILAAAGRAFRVALVVEAQQFSSPELAQFLEKQARTGRELCFIIGGPDGLPDAVVEQSDYRWSLGKLTYPHDLAMVILLEALYRASSISAGHPYHRGANLN